MTQGILDRTNAEADGPRVMLCPICQGRKFEHRFELNRIPIESCVGCGLRMQNPQPSDSQLAEIYGPDYFIGAINDDRLRVQFEAVKRATARLQLSEIEDYRKEVGSVGGQPRLVEIGCGHGHMLLEAQARGYDVNGYDVSADAAATANKNIGKNVVRVGSILDIDMKGSTFDVCILADVIEHVRNPREFISQVAQILVPGATIYIATPSLDSWSGKLLGRHWMEYKREHLYYFDAKTIKRLLTDLGFERIRIGKGQKILTPEYIIGHFEKFPVPLITAALRVVKFLLPKRLLEWQMKVTASGISVFASKRGGV